MIISAIAQGFLWAVLGIGLYLTYRILKFPDLTTEGSFPLGAAVAVTAIVSDVPPILAIFLAIIAGMGAGLVTGLLYTKGKVPVILAGILVMSGLHSVMLFIMKRPNINLLNQETIFDLFNGLPNYYDVVFIGVIVLVILISVVLAFFYTNLGQAFIATGDNEDMARSLGIRTDNMKILGLVISNGVIALAGALVSQNNGYADVNGGTGVIVIGLASLIIGEVMFKDLKLGERLCTIVIGSVLYQILLLGVIELGFDTTYIRIFSSVILAICLMIPQIRKSLNLGTLIGRGEKA
ncbi:ABC transporter permease [Marinilactibacillus psychrotolerans]|uniref:ABC transporter permease n=3 Tax=Carnobacteriaceae TaxID=186828 RepID=A0A511H2X5_9LACT|nr:branched-chain amino acid ABC transporter permease [Marinilactibacillus psychrotolerans]TLQ06722.1 ABC transporter permease [Marinilactibacillus psychrotolerans]SDC69350.1 putative ABC transport system permease protein [Marinilactibacillus psychrotolerans]SJN43940.1 ABC transporter permease protein [Marinilactibacillus psychrotolerans 42ea]GEL67744.1 ABC transporter permease [Marinilactibacillus psychrotolerans]GEQ32371.1 branched-chain amino acid ABC transporter permease protein [Marinilac